MKRSAFVRAAYDRWWVFYVYILISAIACISFVFNASLVRGIAAFAACWLGFNGGAGFMGSWRGRRDSPPKGAQELLGIAVVALGIVAVSIALMLWAGFWLTLFGVAINGVYWALVGTAIALAVTKKEDVQ
jgi:hypothetical protein